MDADLSSITKIQLGEEAGLRELMSRHRDALFRFIYRYVKNEADATELTEDTFIRVFQNAHRFRPKAKVVTWVFSIAGNLCRDHNRKFRKRRGELSLNSEIGSEGGSELGDSIPDRIPNPQDTAISRELFLHMESVIHGLPHKLKFPFIFCVLEENSHDSCAEILKTNRKTVEMRIYRARKLLKDRLARYLQ